MCNFCTIKIVGVSLDDSEKVDLKPFLIWTTFTEGIFENAFGTTVPNMKNKWPQFYNLHVLNFTTW